ncbi:MAG: response regulator [Anaerolineae bacterium]|nr:response regulator [Anaerolineae bacterium]
MNRLDADSIDILLVEDNPGDVRLTREALKDSKIQNRLYVAEDGVEAIRFLRHDEEYSNAPRPDIILLDLNLPRMHGSEVLREIKSDDELKTIPVVVLTTSDDEHDVLSAYDLQANCYITKPVDMIRFVQIVKTIEDFWFTIVKLPPHHD